MTPPTDVVMVRTSGLVKPDGFSPSWPLFIKVSLSVDNPQKVLLMGMALDYGTCKGVKKNGEPCSKIVNNVSPRPVRGRSSVCSSRP